MSYQKCPICKGSGYTDYPLLNQTCAKCNTCNGKGIISELTGLPPKELKEKEFFKRCNNFCHCGNKEQCDVMLFNVI